MDWGKASTSGGTMSNITSLQYQEMVAKLNRATLRGDLLASGQSVSPAVRRERGLHDEITFECNRRGWLTVHSRMDVPSTVQVGCPDFLILADRGRTFLVEAKSRDGKLRQEQRAWLAWAAKLGHKATVCRSLDEFL